MFPSTPTKGMRVAAVLTPLGSQSSQQAPATASPPPWGLESGPAMQDDTAVLPANPSLATRGSAPPPTGRGLGAGGPAGSGPTALRQLPALQNNTGFRTSSPSWADMVRNGSCLDTLPPAATASASASTTANFLALYDRCISSSLQAQINLCNSAGVQEITLTCQIPSSFASAPRRHRRHHPHRRGQAVSVAATICTSHQSYWLHHQPGPCPHRPCHPRPSSRHQCPCRLPRHRPRSGRERPLRGAARSSF
jgi:hypothetical protein